MAIAADHELVVVEDAAHSHAGLKGERPAGSIGDPGSFSVPVQQEPHVGRGRDRPKFRCLTTVNRRGVPHVERLDARADAAGSVCVRTSFPILPGRDRRVHHPAAHPDSCAHRHARTIEALLSPCRIERIPDKRHGVPRAPIAASLTLDDRRYLLLGGRPSVRPLDRPAVSAARHEKATGTAGWRRCPGAKRERSVRGRARRSPRCPCGVEGVEGLHDGPHGLDIHALAKPSEQVTVTHATAATRGAPCRCHGARWVGSSADDHSARPALGRGRPRCGPTGRCPWGNERSLQGAHNNRPPDARSLHAQDPWPAPFRSHSAGRWQTRQHERQDDEAEPSGSVDDTARAMLTT